MFAEEQMSNLYIKDFEAISGDTGTSYRAALGNTLELLIFVSNDSVRKLEMISTRKSTAEINTMLTGWSQIVSILHTNLEVQDEDALFHLIGVGPNGDLSQVIAKTFTYMGIHYEVLPTDKGYTFRASYDQPQ